MKHLPNSLTILRVLLTPVVMALLLTETWFGEVCALVLFIVAAVSDYYDGKLARSYGVHSRFGQFLDPLADKILVLGTFVALALLMPQIVPWWAIALIAARDVAITAFRSWAEARGHSLRTLPAAKAKTTAQLAFLITILVLLVGRRLPGVIGAAAMWLYGSVIPYSLLLVVVVLTVGTGILYFLRQDFVSSAQDSS